MTEEKKLRVRQANQVLKEIGNGGSRPYYSHMYERMAKFGLDKHGTVGFVDATTGMKLYPIGADMFGFTVRGQFRELVSLLGTYIETGDPLDAALIPEDDRWGYGEEMKIVRRAVLATGVFITKGEKE